MVAEKQSLWLLMTHHLQELMADAELYGWEPIRAFHAVWLQQLENGQVKWDDVKAKLWFHHTLVWHPATSMTSAKMVTGQAPLKKLGKEAMAYNIAENPDTKACSCFNQSDHPKSLHIIILVLPGVCQTPVCT